MSARPDAVLVVSIPERDFSWFQPVTGKMVYRYGEVSIPERDFSWFQRDRLFECRSSQGQFQSLKGILVDFNYESDTEDERLSVSIPERDFSWFQLWACLSCKAQFGLYNEVSIPERDFSWFQRCGDLVHVALEARFQSLKGILVDFNDISAPRNWFSPVSIPERDFSWFQPGSSP